MKNYEVVGMKESGFTLLEVLTVIGVLAILVAIAIPTFSTWLPNYRLKSAARGLYSDMQMAKLGAIKNNVNWAIVFDRAGSRYYVCSDSGTNGTWDGPAAMGGDDSAEKAVDLSDYAGVDYGHGNATVPIGTVFDDDITYSIPVNNVAVFNPRGTSNTGYIYFENSKNTTYGIGTRTTGVILLRKWTGTAWE